METTMQADSVIAQFLTLPVALHRKATTIELSRQAHETQ